MIKASLASGVRKLDPELCAKDWDLIKKDFIKFLVLVLLLDLVVLALTFALTTSLSPIPSTIMSSPKNITFVAKRSTIMIFKIKVSRVASYLIEAINKILIEIGKSKKNLNILY